MRELETSEKAIAELQRANIDLKKSQPFFNGQLATNVIESGNTYDYQLSGVPLYPPTVIGYVRFKNQSKIVPFSKIIVEVRNSPTARLPINKCSLYYSHRGVALYAMGSVVVYKFAFNINNAGSNLYFKYYAITNDTGGSFEIYGGDWSY